MGAGANITERGGEIVTKEYVQMISALSGGGNQVPMCVEPGSLAKGDLVVLRPD